VCSSDLAGDSLTISLHGVDNQLQNTTTVFQNGEYIFWGHNEDDLELAYSSIFVQDSFYYPFERIWKIRNFTQNTYPLDFTLDIPNEILELCSLNEAETLARSMRLFVSASPDFDFYETQIFEPQIIEDKKLRFDNLIFSDSVSYFTFGYNKNVIDSLDFYNSNTEELQNNEQNPLYQVFTEADWQPNPVIDNLTINYKLTRSATVWFSLHYNNGMPITQTSPQNLSAGYHQSFIAMSTLTSGIYTVYIHVDDMIAAQVIIKL
jgi:hypothetical protein